jgi:hypothetical protein
MVLSLLLMLAILVIAGVVVLYVAYPHRGEDVPVAPWLGEAMKRGVDALPTIEPLDGTEDDEHEDSGWVLHDSQQRHHSRH